VVPGDCVENLLLRGIFAEDSIEAVLIFAIVDHALVIADDRGDYAGSEAAVHLYIISILLGNLLGGLTEGAFLIVCRTLHKRLRKINCYFMHGRIAFDEVGPRR
jgi:hypothetical protein